eukprot:TRINITY_DN94639_c0_g1_i1.p1 TRINITY_DN94639_c0_g1~~TRINITY_DN94639_c0_g1_i1.p1  ORF type:complete len:249 (+),score=30.75 TRINITY_DN94639_c0_g1_i1:173-919(+)
MKPRRAPGSLMIKLLRPPCKYDSPASQAIPFEKPMASTGPEASKQLFQWLERLRPAEHISLEAIGSHAILRALKALANSGPLHEPTRFVPVEFEVPPPPPVTGEPKLRRSLSGRAIRGIRFLAATASAAPTAQRPSLSASIGPPLRVAARTHVMRLAQAICLERRMRDRSTPVAIEATCSRQHALVLCKGLAKAQQLALLTGNPEYLLSCTAYVTKALPESEGGAKECDLHGSPRLIRVFVWTPDCIA